MRLFSIGSKQKKNLPVVYQLGWWAHQKMLDVSSFEVTVIKSQLNLLNSISVIRYVVKGWLQPDSFGMPYIQAVHHSEQLKHVQDSFSQEKEEIFSSPVHALIELTPIVGIKNKKNSNKERVAFEIINEYNIKSLQWGANNFMFRCAGIERVICLNQTK
jgi:hypothetical protein